MLVKYRFAPSKNSEIATSPRQRPSLDCPRQTPLRRTSQVRRAALVRHERGSGLRQTSRRDILDGDVSLTDSRRDRQGTTMRCCFLCEVIFGLILLSPRPTNGAAPPPRDVRPLLDRL